MYDNAIVDRAVQLVLGVYGVNIQPDLIVTATWEDVVRYGDSASSTKVSCLIRFTYSLYASFYDVFIRHHCDFTANLVV